MEPWLQKYRGYLALSLVYAVLLGGALLWRQPAPAAIRIVEPTPRPSHTPAWVVVHVTGAVRHPGVYTLAENSRLKDAVEAAGGLASDADQAALNLATVLRDGQRVHVPASGESAPVAAAIAPASAPAASTSAQPGALININTASAKELESLPGIGAVLAQRILDDRQANGPYAAVDDLVRVRGIGPVVLENLRPLVTVN